MPTYRLTSFIDGAMGEIQWDRRRFYGDALGVRCV